ncbi:MAG: hypothetical protein KAT11_00580 [Phycisphaerae bacterium]|nr:hypothetical protein [Phycisphaerae bacterium]
MIPDGHLFKLVIKEAGAINHADFISRHVDDCLDVGLLEVSPNSARAIQFFVDFKELYSGLNFNQDYPVILTGYPGAYIKQIAPNLQAVSAFTLASVALASKKWLNLTLDRKPTAATDLFIDYDPGDNLKLLNPTLTSEELLEVQAAPPPLGGISGAGIWLLRMEIKKSGFRYPKPLLCGIQVSVVNNRYIRGTKIGVWLDLVERHYSDLQEEIAKAKAKTLD